MKTYLGIDIGSISTNLVLIDEKNQVLDHLYLRTDGNPIKAVQNGLKKLKEKIKGDIEVAGVGTTGSARQLIGAIAGADVVKNEITAHAKGALHFIPEVRTIIEIGGQDSKIIILRDGTVVDFAMNTICLKGNTKITTNPSYFQRFIKELKIGQRVLTHNGQFKEVEQLFERKYQGEMIKIEVSSLKKIEITPEHPIFSIKRRDIKCWQGLSRRNIAICKPSEERICKKQCRKWKHFSFVPKFISARYLSRGDFIVTPLPAAVKDINSINYIQLKENQHLSENLPSRLKKKISEFVFKPDLCRVLGYYLAEGSIAYNPSRKDKKIKYPSGITFVFNIIEKSYTEDIEKIISKNFSNLTIKIIEKPDRHARILEIYSRSFAEYVKYLCGSGADKKRLSHELLSLEPSLQKEILKGFFRGDGQLRKRPRNALGSNKLGNRYVASTVSEVLAHQLYWLLLRNKIKCTLGKSSLKTKGGKYVYFISVHGKDINKLEDKILVNPKKQGYKSFIYKNWLFEPIKEIKKYKFNGNVYNLKVRDDNSYVANFMALHNCAAGCGAFLDAQASRLKIPVEEFGSIAVESEKPTNISGRCTVFAESDMIHKQQVGHSIKDVVAGLCQSLVRNYLNNVAKGKDIQAPIVFQGGVSENTGIKKAFEKALGKEIIIPQYNKVMGAFGMALLAKQNSKSESQFKGFEISNQEINCASFECRACPNYCEIIEARIDGKVVSRWGDRCGKWSS